MFGYFKIFQNIVFYIFIIVLISFYQYIYQYIYQYNSIFDCRNIHFSIFKNLSWSICVNNFSYRFIYRCTNNPTAKEHLKTARFSSFDEVAQVGRANGRGCPSRLYQQSENSPVTLHPDFKKQFL
jgi:hypothetical protein